MTFRFFNKHRSFSRPAAPAQQPVDSREIPSSIEEAIGVVKSTLGESPDVIFRSLSIGDSGIRGSIVYIEGLTENSVINRQLMESILSTRVGKAESAPSNLLDLLAANVIPISPILRIGSLSALTDALLRGHAVLLVDGYSEALGMNAAGWPMRDVKEPTNENEIRGPRESFIEDLSTNIALIRRKINDVQLRFDRMELGKETKTQLCLAYMKGVAPDSLIEEVKSRIGQIRTRGILESNYIEEWIQDHPKSLFPQIDITEKPDRAAAMLLEGRVAILTDGTPFVLMAPTVFLQLFTTSGDYYLNFWFASFLRLLRLTGFLVSLVTPALYIAVTTMHQEMFPTPLALRIAGARADVPFPAIVEALILETAFELLREAGIRLPKVAGQAVSIVGALIIGQAAVEAGIVSPIMVIVVAITGISSFSLPSYGLASAVRLIRFPLMILASILGIPGITVALLALLTYLASMKSFGVPFLSPLSNTMYSDWKDTLIRLPLPVIGRGNHRFGKPKHGFSEFDPEESPHVQEHQQTGH